MYSMFFSVRQLWQLVGEILFVGQKWIWENGFVIVCRVFMLLLVLVGKNLNFFKLQFIFSISLEIVLIFGIRGIVFLVVVFSSGLVRFGLIVNCVFVLVIFVSCCGFSIVLVFIIVLGIFLVIVWIVLIVYLVCRVIFRMCILLVINVFVIGIVCFSFFIMIIGIIGLMVRIDFVFVFQFFIRVFFCLIINLLF